MLDANGCPEGLVAAALKDPLWKPRAYVPKFPRRLLHTHSPSREYTQGWRGVPSTPRFATPERGTLRTR